jgi:hydroxyethylthiazole kinase-like uncharacterized protein yjeF
MKIFRSEQIREIDEFTIRNEPISSADLMERAAGQLLKWHMRTFDRSRRVVIFTGPGNNGGDGLSLARQLSDNRFSPEVFNVKFTGKTSADWNLNQARLEKETSVPFRNIVKVDEFPFIGPDDIVVDAIFGSGLTRPVTGLPAAIIKRLNETECTVVSIDIPSGLFGGDNAGNDPESIVRADYTLSFQFPKISFMFAENSKFVGEWFILPIGLNNRAIVATETPFSFLEDDFVESLLKKRNKFDHKGIYGHGLLIAGSYGKMGAALLGASAALRTGIGLVTCHIPSCGTNILQTYLPEAMLQPDKSEKLISGIEPDDRFVAAGIGPGIGTDPVTQKAFHSFLLNRNKPLVIDADGINILGMNRKWLSVLPKDTILTPHVKEFERIAGKSVSSYERLEKAISLASQFNCIIVLKGAYSTVVTSQGKIFFNSTGNPGMATAGSGDTLTGIILSLLAQGYTSENAAIVGVYIHGLAGDIAAGKRGYESLIASDIIDCLGDAFIRIRSAEEGFPTEPVD